MTTALQIVNGAAEELGVKTAEATLEAEDSQLFFDRMNDMLVDWADAGITPAFSEVFNLDDDIQIDRNAVRAAKYNLALSCAPSFDRIVTPALSLLANQSLDRLRASSLIIGTVALPDTLPTGSGNDCSDVFVNDRFFNQNKTENF